MNWKIDTWKHGSGVHTAVSVQHCGNPVVYNIRFHDLKKILTCKHCGAKMPESKMSKMLQITKVIKKYDLDY